MITVRPLDSIHHIEGGWFSANWHFSFDQYRDPENTQFGDLRVFNDDRLIPGAIWWPFQMRPGIGLHHRICARLNDSSSRRGPEHESAQGSPATSSP